MSDLDVIDALAGLTPDSPLAAIRDRKPITRQQAQTSFAALFEGAITDVTQQERFVLAAFVAGLHARPEISAFYSAGLTRTAPPPSLTPAESRRTTYPPVPVGPSAARRAAISSL